MNRLILQELSNPFNIKNMIESIGWWFRNKIQSITYAFNFFLFLLKETVNFPWNKRVGFKVLIMQIYFTGVEALSVIALISLGIGAVIIIQGVSILPMFGQGSLMYSILIMIITRELGPLLTAFIITARSGSAITTELGNMVISHEMEAYMSIGLHPISYLGVPRLYGVVLAMLFLNIYFNLFGLLGSYIVASFIHNLPFDEYLLNLIQALTMEDIFSALLKSIVFGVIVAVVSIYYGFDVNRAVTEVPQKTIKSIGTSITLCILADAVIVILTRI